MQTFYFGPTGTALYGAYHEPSGPIRNEGIVLCYPFGQEYMRAHRSFRRLAINLAACGYSVLRFDFRGTGDSSGDLENVKVEDWLQDIHCAVQELKDIAAVANISLMGLRLGGVLAAAAAQNLSLSRIVIWDALVSGKAYCDEILQEIAARPSRSRYVDTNGDIHFNGFCLPYALQIGLSNIDIMAMNHLRNVPWGLIVSHEQQGFKMLRDQFSSNTRFSYQLAPAPHDWNYVDHVGGILWPAPIVAAIEQYFVKAA